MAKWDDNFRMWWMSKNSNDTIRSKFFVLSDGHLFSFPATNGNKSDQNCPITASAVGHGWGATAFSGGAISSQVMHLSQRCRKGEDGLMSSSVGQWLFLSSTVCQSANMELGLLDPLYD